MEWIRQTHKTPRGNRLDLGSIPSISTQYRTDRPRYSYKTGSHFLHGSPTVRRVANPQQVDT